MTAQTLAFASFNDIVLIRRDKIALGLAVLALAFVVAAEMLAPEPVDWTPSHERGDSRPYASQVLYEQLPQLFPAAARTATDQPPYLVLRRLQARHADQIGATTYLFLAEQFAPDLAEAEQLLGFVEEGGTVFVAAERFAGPLADSLHLETRFAAGLSSSNTTTLDFSSPSLAGVEAQFQRRVAGSDFARFDTARTEVLATRRADSAATYLRVEAGKGAFFLSTTPRVFSNYALLEGHSRNACYAYAALSHLPAGTERLLWDGHYKPARTSATTPLRVVLTDPLLRTAYILLMLGAVLFAIFEGRRRQRAVPVVEPPSNETAGFVRTVGQLYFERGDHAHLARKKATHFRTYARERLRLRIEAFEDEATRERVAERSGVPAEDVNTLFDILVAAESVARLSESDLQTLSRRLAAFYEKSQR